VGVKRVAVLTGGGDCPGLNAVIRGVVRVGIEKFRWEILGVEDAFSGLVDTNYRSPHGNVWLTLERVGAILDRGGTILGTSNRSDPFRFVVKDPNGKEIETDVSDRVMDNLRALSLDAVISIGGDGSMRISKKFMEKGMPIVGVPKTIDNDLACTDQTFGFDTAVNIATEAIDRLRTTADSHDRVMLIEVMGRDAGWIALHAGIAGGADAILLPEIPYRIDKVAESIRVGRGNGKNYSLIVVAEGAKPAGGDTSVIEHKLGEMPRLMGAAQRVAAGLSKLVEAEMRVTVLGHLQRGGTPSSFDRILATRYGVAAAELVAEEKFGYMVALRGDQIVSVPIAEAVAEPKRVAADSQIVRAAKAVGTIFGD
jgi:ATP-dependent phosphofructokinase / diphosphate-dependent phosphofructokinase